MAGFCSSTPLAIIYKKMGGVGFTPTARLFAANIQTTIANMTNPQKSTSCVIFAITTPYFSTVKIVFATGRRSNVWDRAPFFVYLSISAVVTAFLISVPAVAGLNPRIHVQVHAHSYDMTLTFVVHAPRKRLWHILTDYARLKRLNPDVQSVRVLNDPASPLPVVETRVRSCVLWICFHVRQTETVDAIPDKEIDGLIIPKLSTFKAGLSRWRLWAVPGGTRLQFRSLLVPSFYVPPIIGPWLIREKIHREMRITAQNVNALALAKRRHTTAVPQKVRQKWQ